MIHAINRDVSIILMKAVVMKSEHQSTARELVHRPQHM
jgi:hypothetical protein